MNDLKACRDCNGTWVVEVSCGYCLGGTIHKYLPRRSLDPYVVRPRCSVCDGKGVVKRMCDCITEPTERILDDQHY